MKTSIQPPSVSPHVSASTFRHDVLPKLARGGIAARGVLYAVIGALAIGLAAGAGGKTTSQSGALETIAHQPFGAVVLVVLAIGLGAYAAWRLLDGAYDRGDDSSVSDRVKAVGSGVVYAVLCATTVKVLAGDKPSGGGARQATAGVLGWPGGPVFVVIGGVLLIGAGAFQGYQGVAKKFLEKSDTASMSPETKRVFTALGVAGYCARGVTFGLIGYGLIRAAVDYSPKKAVGLDGALQELIHASYGPILLGIVAAGFLAFGLYSIADARYHKL